MIVLRFVFKRHVQLKDDNHKFEKYVQLHTYIQFLFLSLIGNTEPDLLNINIAFIYIKI